MLLIEVANTKGLDRSCWAGRQSVYIWIERSFSHGLRLGVRINLLNCNALVVVLFLIFIFGIIIWNLHAVPTCGRGGGNKF